jgi:hypothetical protein
MTVRSVPNSREHSRAAYDLVGALSVLGVGGIVLGIHEEPESGWTDLAAIVGALIRIAAVGGFVGYELRRAEPPWFGAAAMGALMVFLALRSPGPPPRPARECIEVESPDAAALAAVSGTGWGR